MTLRHFSSRRLQNGLAGSFLTERLTGAKSYDRIAGYFTSSLFEIAAEALDAVDGPIRIICNSQLNEIDVRTAELAAQGMRREWCQARPDKLCEAKGPSRFETLYRFLSTKKIEVKVLPSDAFGLIHGKAGVIRYENRISTSFIGSVNETRNAWELNYELLWEDDSDESVRWVEEEFIALWNDARAVPLSQCRFIMEDVERISRRKVKGIAEWKEQPEPSQIFIEEPVYREAFGFAGHQKYFIKKACDLHASPLGVRLILADAVGLGKTVQLAAVAAFAALKGSRPVLIVAPKTLLEQWQKEIFSLLSLPSAFWTGKTWIDEQGIEHPNEGTEGLLNCPRRIGIVSQGLITSASPAANLLLRPLYELVIVDEAHRARRREFGPDAASVPCVPNNLLRFIQEISKQTHSLLLATATPVQIHPVEAWDLLNALAEKGENVLGNSVSPWRNAADALDITLEKSKLPNDIMDFWVTLRNPFPLKDEGKDFSWIRQQLRTKGVKEFDAVLPDDVRFTQDAALKQKISQLRGDFGRNHNPFIRTIIRRTREYLEHQIDQNTGAPFLKPIGVELIERSIPLTTYLQAAYDAAETFSILLGRRKKSVGFLKTMLLRRMGSSILAGQKTAQKILAGREDESLVEDDQDEEDFVQTSRTDASSLELLPDEFEALQRFSNILKENKSDDPKLAEVLKILKSGIDSSSPWLEFGCILFSQYFDTAEWIAERLSKEFPAETVALYAGGTKSALLAKGTRSAATRKELKELVTCGKVRLMVGTDAASEGLNLQALGSLINVDLPWNPTRLEQRKGRIQRIGQALDRVRVCNLRYSGSVEDRVHELLSDRLKNILDLFGQVPDVLEDVWVEVAQGKKEEAKKRINELAQKKHPFELRFSEVKSVDWESCAEVLDKSEKLVELSKGWKK
jgi:hypothetical protein